MTWVPLFSIHLARAGQSSPALTSETLVLQCTPRGTSAMGSELPHQLLARPQDDGMAVLIHLGENGQPVQPFEQLTLRFKLIQRDPRLGYSLNLKTLQSLRIPTFTNQAQASDLQLAEGKAHQGDGSGANRPLAWVEIGAISSAWAQEPPAFVLTLPPKEARWVYYFICKQNDKRLQISDSEPERALEFDHTLLAPGTWTTDQDRVAGALLEGNPGAKVYRFSSKRSPPGSGRTLKGLRLQLNDQTIIAHLPPPPMDHLMRLPLPNQQSEDALYRVIRL